MGGQYVIVAPKVTIVGWLLCEAVDWSTLGGSHRLFFTKIVMLFAYLGFLYVVLVRLSTALRGGVHGNVVLFCSPLCGGISIIRVLLSCVLEIILSGPRLLLSALALGMCVLGLVVDPPVLFSFVLSSLFALLVVSLFPLCCPLVSVLLFLWPYLSPLGLLV